MNWTDNSTKSQNSKTPPHCAFLVTGNNCQWSLCFADNNHLLVRLSIALASKNCLGRKLKANPIMLSRLVPFCLQNSKIGFTMTPPNCGLFDRSVARKPLHQHINQRNSGGTHRGRRCIKRFCGWALKKKKGETKKAAEIEPESTGKIQPVVLITGWDWCLLRQDKKSVQIDSTVEENEYADRETQGGRTWWNAFLFAYMQKCIKSKPTILKFGKSTEKRKIEILQILRCTT